MKRQEKLKSKDINKASEILKNGGVVIFPTDTVYGIGARVDNKEAEERIRNIKNTQQSFPILVENFDQVNDLAYTNDEAKKLIKKYWPGPLTILTNSKQINNKIGIRMPKGEKIRSLLNLVGSPIFATSANFHGGKTPRSYEELDPKIKSLADYVLEGECDSKVESTIIDTTTNPPILIREGAIKINGTGN